MLKQNTATKRISNKNLTQFSEHLHIEIKQFFTTEEINQLARETKFVKREGKIDGRIFLELIVFSNESLKQQSLNDLSATLEHNYAIEMTKQSLHERFNNNALHF